MDMAEAELARADQARASGVEGRARVCARRAAGFAIQGYLQAHEMSVGSISVIELIGFFRDQPDVSNEMRQVLDHLLLRVNTESELPASIDLIAETRWLVSSLNKD
jgi:hypothetical protein